MDGALSPLIDIQGMLRPFQYTDIVTLYRSPNDSGHYQFFTIVTTHFEKKKDFICEQRDVSWLLS